MSIEIPWVKIPKTQFEQVNYGTKGIVFRLSPQYVAKVLYEGKGNNARFRNDNKATGELEYECEINTQLYEFRIGNPPKPIGIERLRLNKTSFPSFIMEYITLPRGDELNFIELGISTELAKQEALKATDLELYPGKDYLNPANFFYDSGTKTVRLIDFGRWEH